MDNFNLLHLVSYHINDREIENLGSSAASKDALQTLEVTVRDTLNLSVASSAGRLV